MTGSIGSLGVTASSISVQGNALVVAGPATLTNTGGAGALYVSAVAGPESLDVDLGPGKTFALGPPPAGHAWHIEVVNQAQLRRALDDMGWLGLGVLALAGYGAFKAAEALLDWHEQHGRRY